MAFVRVILLTKNETDMIQSWIDYYCRVMPGGAKDVIIVDNGSTDEVCINAYKAHVKNGGTVMVNSTSFRYATVFMSKIIKDLAHTCEWLLPLETDEFVCTLKDDEITPEIMQDRLIAYLSSLPPDIGSVQYAKVLASMVDPKDEGYSNGCYSHPLTQIRRFYDQKWVKIIVRACAVE